MSATCDKAIITNVSAMKKKYGPAYTKIAAAVDKVIAADKAKGLNTLLVALDDATQMKRLKAKPVTKASDPKQNKGAIDGVYRTLTPDYLAILGSIDVVPHQDLLNPLYDPKSEDDDKFAYGDLPYACEAPYSQKTKDFIGPTRVVGRIPDVTGEGDPGYLVGLLETAAGYAATDLETLKSYFAVSAQIWDKSTIESAGNIFGTPATVNDVPANTYQWSDAQLAGRLQFFNCHGAPQSPQFYGQPRSGQQVYPPALDAAYVDGKLKEGTILAAECCYGGELYRLSATQKQIGLCNVYLANKAYGFFASTTIAYGPASGNGQADYICQYFLQGVSHGASLGRAALEARQNFVRKASPLDPSDLKTLAQFNLYGDPSITALAGTKAAATTASADSALTRRSERKDRRRMLFREGSDLLQKEPFPERLKRQPKGTILATLRNSVESEGGRPSAVLSFQIRHRTSPKMPRRLLDREHLPTAFHVIFSVRSRRSKAAAVEQPGIIDIVAYIGKEVDGKLVSVNKIRSR
ncbi:hypothetical protein Q2941_44345 [Bradyrhizobium sp. UFLA05-153]